MSEIMTQPPRSRRDRLKALLRPLCERLGIATFSRPGLNHLDRALARLLPQREGWFVEVGANDGFQQSNTYYLARFKGWRGVLVEPVPQLAAACRVCRPEAQVFQCALGSPEAAGTTLSLRYAGLMTAVCGTFDDEQQRAAQGLAMQGLRVMEHLIQAPVRTLNDVLEESRTPAQFDLLSLDVEGYEVEVLKGLDLDRYRPQALCLEVQSGHLNQVRQLLGAHYDMVEVLHESQHHGDYFWARR